MTNTREIQEKTWTMRPFPLAIKKDWLLFIVYYLSFSVCHVRYLTFSVLFSYKYIPDASIHICSLYL